MEQAIIAQSLVLSGLVTKRSELAGRIEALQQEADALAVDVKTLDGAIRIIAPEYDLRSIRPRRRRSKNQFFTVHGEASRFVLDTLRAATGPLSTNEIAELAVTKNGFKNPDIKALRACVLTTLSRQRTKGVALEVGRDASGAIKWRLAN